MCACVVSETMKIVHFNYLILDQVDYNLYVNMVIMLTLLLFICVLISVSS